ESGEVMATGVLDGGMERSERLHEDFALHLTTAGASGHLGEQLEGPFARAEVGDVQAEVGVHDPHQGYVWEMEAFGDHLRADQNVDFAGPEVGEDAAVVVFALEHVGVHPPDAGGWEKAPEGLLDPLGSQTGVANRWIGA